MLIKQQIGLNFSHTVMATWYILKISVSPEIVEMGIKQLVKSNLNLTTDAMVFIILEFDSVWLPYRFKYRSFDEISIQFASLKQLY